MDDQLRAGGDASDRNTGRLVFYSLLNGVLSSEGGAGTIERRAPVGQRGVSIYPAANDHDVDCGVAAAREAFDDGPWPRIPGAERALLINRVADLIERDLDELGRIEAFEGGKPVAAVMGEMGVSVALWRHAASLAYHTYGDTYDSLGTQTTGLVFRQPIGVVGMITPWNFPLLIASQKLPYALAVGCTAVLKPSELTSGTTLRLGELLMEAGLPKGVANIIAGPGRGVGEAVTRNDKIDMISFTGSTAVGKSIARDAADTLKRVSLELGGKAPHVVCADADLDAAADKVVFGILHNAGQCCVSGTRLLVERSIADTFTAQIAERMASIPFGDPREEATRVGPLISREQFETVTRYIEKGRKDGARIVTGGKAATEREGVEGFFVEPTVFADVTPEMAISQEEIFGPVLAVTPFDTIEEAISLANGTRYGLAAGIWTSNIDTAFRFARGVKAGTVEVNTFISGAPELPLVGHGESGVGHEKGRFAVDEFTELKTVQVQFGPHQDRWWDGRA